MPNWCENILSVQGPGIEIFDQLFKGKIACWSEKKSRAEWFKQDLVYCLNALHPVPEEIIDKKYTPDGYMWCLNNWGTKWDINDVQVQVNAGPNMYNYTFETAWSPPIKWVNYIAPRFIDLVFVLSFFEGGNGFAGQFKWKDGQCIQSHEYDDLSDRRSLAWDMLADTFGYEYENNY